MHPDQAEALGEAGLGFRSSLARQRGRHVGQGCAVSREKAGGHSGPTVSTLSLVTWQAGRLEAASHHWTLSVACQGSMHYWCEIRSRGHAQG